jgi:hypothetical protein
MYGLSRSVLTVKRDCALVRSEIRYAMTIIAIIHTARLRQT